MEPSQVDKTHPRHRCIKGIHTDAPTLGYDIYCALATALFRLLGSCLDSLVSTYEVLRGGVVQAVVVEKFIPRRG
jgi:hypothetical protein